MVLTNLVWNLALTSVKVIKLGGRDHSTKNVQSKPKRVSLTLSLTLSLSRLILTFRTNFHMMLLAARDNFPSNLFSGETWLYGGVSCGGFFF